MSRKGKRTRLPAVRGPHHRLTRSSHSEMQHYKNWGLDSLTKLNLTNSKTMRMLKRLWDNYHPDKLEEGYRHACRAVRFMRYDAVDVEKFSLLMGMHNNDPKFSWKAGFFLSALINHGKDENYIVHTKQLHESLDFLGFRNTKNIHVIGDLGSKAGCCMKSGFLHIHGDAKTWIGDGMKGGQIIVEGSTISDVGIYMKKGHIIIKGNAGSRIGCHMSGGTIEVDGNAQDVGLGMSGGKISVNTHADLIGQDMTGGEICLDGTYGKIGKVVLGEISHKGKPISEFEFKEKFWFWLKQHVRIFKELVVSPRFTMRYMLSLSFTVVSYPIRFVGKKLRVATDYAKFKIRREGKLDESE